MIAGTSALAAFCWRKDAIWIAFLLLASSVIYFLPSVVMMFDGSPLDDITALRQSGSPHIIKSLAAATVVASLLLLTRCALIAAIPRPIPTALASMLLIGMFTLDTPPDSQRVINTLSLVGMLLLIGVHAYLHQRTVETTYALAMAAFCFAVGVLMRYQVYPVWIWVALMLSPCFALWKARLRFPGVLRWAYP